MAGRLPPPGTRLRGNGAETVAFDFFDRSTWQAALSGVEALFPLPGGKATCSGSDPACTCAGCTAAIGGSS